jgi:hypothetical protein
LSALKYYITDPIITESTVAWQAALFYRDLGYQRVELEGDALQVVHALRKECCNLSKYEHIIEETCGVLNSLFQWKVSRIWQMANEAGHTFAKETLILLYI